MLAGASSACSSILSMYCVGSQRPFVVLIQPSRSSVASHLLSGLAGAAALGSAASLRSGLFLNPIAPPLSTCQTDGMLGGRPHAPRGGRVASTHARSPGSARVGTDWWGAGRDDREPCRCTRMRMGMRLCAVHHPPPTPVRREP